MQEIILTAHSSRGRGFWRESYPDLLKQLSNSHHRARLPGLLPQSGTSWSNPKAVNIPSNPEPHICCNAASCPSHLQRCLSRQCNQLVGSKSHRGISLVVQWLRLNAPNAGGLGPIPGQGTGPHMPQLRWKIPSSYS